jgi:nicotinamide riboside kinase
MPHSMIVGITMSGKTTLAINLAEEFNKRGFPVLVFDPIHDARWKPHAALQTANKDEFLRAFYASKGCRVFIDESGEVASNQDQDIITTATRGRHYGHACVYISQRAPQIARNIRSQCFQVFAFRQHNMDAKLLAQEFGAEDLKQCSRLQRGEFIHSNGYETKKGKIF